MSSLLLTPASGFLGAMKSKAQALKVEHWESLKILAGRVTNSEQAQEIHKSRAALGSGQ
jgi:hypothetical protein